MLRTGTVGEIRSGRLTRAHGHVVLAMRLHPRGMARALRDEFIAALAPERALLDDFHAARAASGDHDGAFDDVDYLRRFALSVEAVSHLARLAALARDRDVFLVCQCDAEQRCHRDLLLLAAHAWFGTEVAPPRHDYAAFAARLGAGHLARQDGHA